MNRARTPRVVIVIPHILPSSCVDRVLQIYSARAGFPCRIFMVEDVDRVGWVAIHNKMFKKLKFDYYVYSAQDYFPGRDFIKKGIGLLEKSKCLLLGFNDGKNPEINATAGIVKKNVISELPYESLFFPGYFMHGADPELTERMIAKKKFLYAPEILCVEVDYNKDITGGTKYPADTELFRSRCSEWRK